MYNRRLRSCLPEMLFAGSKVFVEKPGADVESAEKPKEGGIPIDAEAVDKKKTDLANFEKLIAEKYGGQFYKMKDIGVESSDSETHISSPDFNDPKFKGKEPRVIVWFHQNGGQDYSNEQSKKVYEQVKKMRENGDPVVLVMPQDRKKKGTKNWTDFTDDKSFKALIGQAEKVTGQRLAGNISFASSSGGYKGIGNVLRSLREAGDPRAKELYQGIKQIGLCDSLYGEEDEIAQWAVSDPQKRLYSYNGTESVKKHNKILKEKIQGLLNKVNREMGDNIQILSDDLHKAGHDVDREMLAKYLEAPTGSPDYGLNFPPRAPDAMTGKQFNEALAECKTPEQRFQLIAEQALAGAISPSTMKPKMYTTFVNGEEVKIPLYGTVKFGVPGNETIPTFSGPEIQFIADFVGGHLPPAQLYARLYEDPNVRKVPFWMGEHLEGLVNARRREQGLPPLPINTPDGQRSGKAMRSVEYASAHNDMLERWLKQHGIGPDEFMIGNRKTVFMPHEANPRKIKFGGGLYAMPVIEDGKVVDFTIKTDQFVQGVGDNAHEPGYYDYAQEGAIMGDPIIAGKKVPLRDVLTKPEYEGIRKALFSDKPLGPECRYNLPTWAQNKISEYHREHPVGSPRPYIPPAEIAAAPEQPATAGIEPPSKGGIPVDTGPSYAPSTSGGRYGGGYSSAAPSPESYSNVEPVTYKPSPTDKPAEKIEDQPSGKVFVLGDSLSDGFVKGFTGMDVTHVHPGNKEKSSGQTAREMVTTLRQKILNSENLAGATLVIIGGSNDIFGPHSLEQIKKDLETIWTLAKEKGMKVIGATLPPLAHSSYSKDWAAKTNTPYEKYNADLVDRWQKLNEWIMGQEGAKDTQGKAIGPDKVLQLHKKFEDPQTPGKLRADLYGKGGDGVHLANYGEMSELLKGGVAEVSPAQPAEETQAAAAPKNLTSNMAKNNTKWRQQLPEGYKAADAKVVGQKAQELLGELKMGETSTFEIGGKKYMAVKEYHSGDPTRPNPHPGVSVVEVPEESGSKGA